MRLQRAVYSQKTRSLLGRYAVASRWNRPEKKELGRQWAESTLSDHITHLQASCPPLADEQIERLTALLRGGERE